MKAEVFMCIPGFHTFHWRLESILQGRLCVWPPLPFFSRIHFRALCVPRLCCMDTLFWIWITLELHAGTTWRGNLVNFDFNILHAGECSLCEAWVANFVVQGLCPLRNFGQRKVPRSLFDTLACWSWTTINFCNSQVRSTLSSVLIRRLLWILWKDSNFIWRWEPEINFSS